MSKPKANIKNITSARYRESDKGCSIMIYVDVDGEKGEIEFGLFDTKIEAQTFFKQLKRAKIHI